MVTAIRDRSDLPLAPDCAIRCIQQDAGGWRPHPGPQTYMLAVTGVKEVLYGGARGGGKTDGGLAWLLRGPHFGHPAYRALVLRRNFEDLVDWMDRAERFYDPLGGRLVRSAPARIVFRNGAVFRLGHLKDEAAYTKYQGHEYHRVLIEEAGQIPTATAYNLLLGSARSTVRGVPAEVLLTANPGGLGHSWLKDRFGCGRDSAATWYQPIDPGDGNLRMYIPARVDDNPSIMLNDPTYVAWLESLPEPYHSAWRYGDWDVHLGQAFDWSPTANVVPTVPVPGAAKVLMTYDWGFGKPFSVGWWWVIDSLLVRVAEWYGCVPGQHDAGLRLPDHEVATGILQRERDWGLPPPYLRLADPTVFNRKPDTVGGGQGESTAAVFARVGVMLRPGDPSRKVKFRQMSARLKTRTLVVMDTCKHFIRTVPDLPLDDRTLDDVDTDAEDHCYDEAAHACMEVPLSDAALLGDPVDARTIVLAASQGVEVPRDAHGSGQRQTPLITSVRAGSLSQVLRDSGRADGRRFL